MASNSTKQTALRDRVGEQAGRLICCTAGKELKKDFFFHRVVESIVAYCKCRNSLFGRLKFASFFFSVRSRKLVTRYC